MNIEQIHILKKHDTLKSIEPYFGHREIDTYLCGLMAFNDDISKKDKSNLHKYTKMYMFITEHGITDWKEGSVPIVFFYDANGSISEDDFCKVCRYEFYKRKGLMMGSKMYDRMKGVVFMKEIEDEKNKGTGTRDT